MVPSNAAGRKAARPHGIVLENKARDSSDAVLAAALERYNEFRSAAEAITVKGPDDVKRIVGLINEYRRHVVYAFEQRENSGQENLRSTILEETFTWIFKDIFKSKDLVDPVDFFIGKALESYISLTFAPLSFSKMFEKPNPMIHTKDQDFVLGAAVTIDAKPRSGEGGVKSRNVVIPAIAIESKVYLAKNHLDACAATATRLRAAMPYCMYIVAAEFLKMDEEVAPELTDVSEVFVFCKAANSERATRIKNGLPPHDLDPNLLVDCYNMVLRHLAAIWWSPEDAIARGRVIGRPSAI